MNYKELICLLRTKELVLTTQKGVLYEWKKIWKNLFGEKHLWGKCVHFSAKNTANNADTWEFILQFLQHLYRTANSTGHLVVKFETAQIHRYFSRNSQHISPEKILLSSVVLEYLMIKVKQHEFMDIGYSIFLQAQQQNSQRDLLPICYFPLTVGNSNV